MCVLNFVAWTAQIQIECVVSKRVRQGCGFFESFGITASELQDQWVFAVSKGESLIERAL
jgi:hypothetical protein